MVGATTILTYFLRQNHFFKNCIHRISCRKQKRRERRSFEILWIFYEQTLTFHVSKYICSLLSIRSPPCRQLYVVFKEIVQRREFVMDETFLQTWHTIFVEALGSSKQQTRIWNQFSTPQSVCLAIRKRRKESQNILVFSTNKC